MSSWSADTPTRAPRGLYRLPPQLLWPGLIIALLAGQIVVCFVMMSRAWGDPTVAIEPNYYQKAVNWDADQAARAASAELGWSVAWDIATIADIVGERMVKMTLTDDRGEPINDAKVEVRFFHHARAADRTPATLNHGGEGLYLAAVPMPRPGVWTIDLLVHRGEHRFIQSSQIKIPAAPRTSP